MGPLRIIGAETEAGVDEAGHQKPPADRDLKSGTRFFEVLQAARAADGGDCPIPDEDRTIFNNSKILEGCTPADPTWATES
jgi:hypothetical protein